MNFVELVVDQAQVGKYEQGALWAPLALEPIYGLLRFAHFVRQPHIVLVAEADVVRGGRLHQ